MCVMFSLMTEFQVVLITNIHGKVLPPCTKEETKDQRIRLYYGAVARQKGWRDTHSLKSISECFTLLLSKSFL